MLKRGILAGVDPQSSGYWGDVRDKDQRVVEAADIARVLWLTRSQLWDTLSKHERDLIARWLLGAGTAATARNNWILFPVIVDLVLEKLHGQSLHQDLLV